MKNFHHTENCPIRDILTISSKWAMLILITLDANEVIHSMIYRKVSAIYPNVCSG